MTRIAIADDHALLRESLRALLDGRRGFEVVGEAGTAAETLELVRATPIDVLTLDLSMPGCSGVELIQQVARLRPELPILVLSMHAEQQYAVRALAAGASGYLHKACRGDELALALQRLAAGHRYVGATVAELLALEFQPHADRPAHRALSGREFEVMQALVDGESVSAIAARLKLSVKTVSTHKTNVLRKLSCSSLAELVRYAIAHDFVPDPSAAAPVAATTARAESEPLR